MPASVVTASPLCDAGAPEPAPSLWISLPPYSTERRDALVDLYLQLQEEIDELDKTVAECAAERERARLLMTHPGVGPITALATESILGDPARFADGKAVASYVGLIPSEFSSGGRRQILGRLTKQGSPMLRFLVV